MLFHIEFSKSFKKEYKKLPAVIQTQTKKKIAILSQNSSHQSLRSKTNYSWSNYLGLKAYECSINMNYRMIYTYQDYKIIVLQTIGKHDIVEKAPS